MAEQKDRPVVTLTASDNEHDVASNTDMGTGSADNSTSENKAVASVNSTRSPPGLLDLPSELRLMIFRYLVVSTGYLRPRRLSPERRHALGLLGTCKLIHREVFDVWWKENTFWNYFRSPDWPIIRFGRAIDTIQNVQILVDVRDRSLEMKEFLNFMHHLGNPSIIRGTLTVIFWNCFKGPLKWFIRALGRSTNFKTVYLEFNGSLHDQRLNLYIPEYLKTALEPVLGYADRLEAKLHPRMKGLRFHPLDRRNLRREPKDGDWADSLDGIRLEWNTNVTNSDDSETPAQN
ncbi:hypothetical protein MMC22_002311 [Lobaria immixta]|nr:hypothetical protein [Lobaria immixta]